MFTPKWDERFMRLAHHIGLWSKDRGRRFGAVVIGPDREVRAMGYNGLPRGVDDEVEERHSRENGEKYIWVAHAEANAIFNAARVGVPLKGCALYVPLFPCADCAKAIIQSGIAEVVTYEPDLLSDPVWARSFKVSKKMLEEAGVSVRIIGKVEAILVGGSEARA